MPTIACTGQSEARGRNRWFRLAEAELTTHTHGHTAEARLCLDLYSRRRGRSAPVILRLTAAAGFSGTLDFASHAPVTINDVVHTMARAIGVDVTIAHQGHTEEFIQFVSVDEIDRRYFDRPYYIVPEGKAGE